MDGLPVISVMSNEPSLHPEFDEAFLKVLQNDPDAIVHDRQTTEPFVSELRVTAPVDVLWLAGRRDDDEVAPHLRGVDE